MGSGSLVAEIQEPTDLTLRAERFGSDGSELPWESLHSGIGIVALLDCFDFSTALPRQEIQSKYFTKADLYANKGCEISIGPNQTDCFGLVRVCCERQPLPRKNDSFRVILVEHGNIELISGDTRFMLHQGDEVFVPHGVREYQLAAQSAYAAVLEYIPPAAK